LLTIIIKKIIITDNITITKYDVKFTLFIQKRNNPLPINNTFVISVSLYVTLTDSFFLHYKGNITTKKILEILFTIKEILKHQFLFEIRMIKNFKLIGQYISLLESHKFIETILI
jgi:hypothetical protein